MKRGFRHGLLLLAAALPVLVACPEENLIDDASFDQWCGKKLCSWTTDRGRVERAPSWHPDDHAVSFVETPTRISQLSVADAVDCLRFDMIADVDAEARMALKLDFNDDGIIDFDQEVPAVRWQSVQFVVRAPVSYLNVRYILEKRGQGRAILGQVRAVEEYECKGVRIELADGSKCAVDASCASDSCVEGVCNDCGSRGCGLGESCNRDKDCAEGTCAAGLCSDCAKDGSCPALTRCDADDQCGSGACVDNLAPSSVDYPVGCGKCDSDADCGGFEGACAEGECLLCPQSPLGQHCGECEQDADCGEAKACLKGFCSACRTSDDCAEGEACRYQDRFDALSRVCTSEVGSQALPQGALCESDEECKSGTTCGGGQDAPKRCGVACAPLFPEQALCTGDSVCLVPGVLSRGLGVDPIPTSSWNSPGARVATCYPLSYDTLSCVSHDQCQGGACCKGKCDAGASFNLLTGACRDEDPNRSTE